MSEKVWTDIRPFVSAFILVCTLFSLVFLKMEVRRNSYALWKATSEYHDVQSKNRLFKMKLAQELRPDRIRKFALSKLPLKEARQGQVIQLDGEQIAIPQ